MLALPGQYLKKHSRIYVYLNPDPETGPYAWRLSDLPDELPPAPDITSIFTVLPIDSKYDDPSRTMNLFFNIGGLSDVSVARGQGIGTGKAAANKLLNSRYEGKRTTFGINEIEGVEPVQTLRIGGDVTIYFDIQTLPDATRRRRRFSARLNKYNSRSIDKLSADKPLFTSGSDDIVVTFDITSLENA